MQCPANTAQAVEEKRVHESVGSFDAATIAIPLQRLIMPDHKFKIGQGLNFVPHRTSVGRGASMCKIVRLLPAESDEPLYRIKCNNENFERVVRESELT
jgi:hypothetical protein